MVWDFITDYGSILNLNSNVMKIIKLNINIWKISNQRKKKVIEGDLYALRILPWTNKPWAWEGVLGGAEGAPVGAV